MFMGERLAELRKDKKLTQKQLAIELGMSPRTVSAYERGEFYPSPEAEEKFVHYFKVSLDYLRGLTDDEFPLTKDRYIILPYNYSPEFKKELIYLIELLKSKYKMK